MDKLEKLLSLLDKLTWPRLLMLVCLGVAGSVSAYLWENRETAIPAIASNNVALVALGITVCAIAIGLIGSAAITRMDRKGEALERYLREEVGRLIHKVDAAQARIAEQSRTLDEVLRRESECQEQVQRQRRRIEKAEEALREAGLVPPPRTNWGDLT